ncbi:MAG TPA: DUF6379 domain-containing protein [Cellulomonas sp.]
MTSTPAAALPRQENKGRAFLAGTPIRTTTVTGAPALVIDVRLTSYRALPLSCIDSIEVQIDGTRTDPDRLRLVVDGVPWALADLGRLSTVWWFVLDTAQLVVPVDALPAAGPHEVDGTLVTVEPYVSNGRFLFTSRSVRTLELDLDSPYLIGGLL